MSFLNRNLPVIIAATVGIMSGMYVWEPMFKKYQRESKGTWDYKVVQETRAAEMRGDADAAAASIASPVHSADQQAKSAASVVSTAPVHSSMDKDTASSSPSSSSS